MNARDFVAAFRDAAAKYGRAERPSPGQVVDQWKMLVDLVEAGYHDNIYELHNDLAIRGLIEHLLHDERLGRFEEFGWVREQVAELDQRFRALLRPDPIPGTQRPWWEAHPPRYGGAELVADFKDGYGITIDER